MGVTHFDGLDAVSSFAIGGVTVTLTAAEMNTLHSLGLSGTGGFFDVTVSKANINTGTPAVATIVPGIAGKTFYPTFAAMNAIGGDAATATLVRLIEETSSGVVLSHVRADVIAAAWAGPTGGTVVTTLLNTALVAGKAIVADKTGAALDGAMTGIRFIVAGYYI